MPRKAEYIQIRCRAQQKADYERVSDAQDKSVAEWLRELADAAVREFDLQHSDNTTPDETADR